MKKLLFSILFLGSFMLQAQILDNSECSVFSEEPFFNQQFVKNNNIKSIIGTVQGKRDHDILRDKKLEHKYEFDQKGRLVYMHKTFNIGNGKKDTVGVTFYYNANGEIKVKRKNDPYGFFSYNFKYDTAGHVLEEKYCRDENVSDSKHGFELGKQYVIAKESYKYEPLEGNKLKKKFFNNYGRPYQQTIFVYNDLGYLMEEHTTLLISNKKRHVYYEYEDKGRVVKKRIESNVTKPLTQEYRYEYDEVGNVVLEDYYRNGEHITHREVLYHKDSLLLQAIILRDVNSNMMDIVRYEYEYYD